MCNGSCFFISHSPKGGSGRIRRKEKAVWCFISSFSCLGGPVQRRTCTSVIHQLANTLLWESCQKLRLSFNSDGFVLRLATFWNLRLLIGAKGNWKFDQYKRGRGGVIKQSLPHKIGRKMYVDERVQKCFGLYSKFIKAYTYFSMNWRIIQNDALWLGFLYRFPDNPGLNSLSFLLISNLLFECKIVSDVGC